jgi:hypothetical protein
MRAGKVSSALGDVAAGPDHHRERIQTEVSPTAVNEARNAPAARNSLRWKPDGRLDLRDRIH